MVVRMRAIPSSISSIVDISAMMSATPCSSQTRARSGGREGDCCMLPSQIHVARRHVEPDFLIRHEPFGGARGPSAREERTRRTAQCGERHLNAQRHANAPYAQEIRVKPHRGFRAGAPRAPVILVRSVQDGGIELDLHRAHVERVQAGYLYAAIELEDTVLAVRPRVLVHAELRR